MALGVSYDDVLHHAPHDVRDGLSLRRFHQVAAAFGVRFVLARTANFEDETGLLWVDFPDAAHLAYIHDGTLINPADATVWASPYDYLASNGGDGYLYRIAPVQHGPRQRRHQVRRRE